MRIPFPVRIPLAHSCSFAVILCAVQLLEGTPVYFSLYTFLFVLIATLAFNTAGGFSRPSGGYIFFFTILGVLLGLIVKACLGEAADSNLLVPETTMLVYVVGISGMYCSALLKKLLLPKTSLLEKMGRKSEMGASSIGCFVLGIGIYIWARLVLAASGPVDAGQSVGGVLSIVLQVNNFIPLGIILGVTHTIRRSGGKRFMSAAVMVAIAFSMWFYGILGFSKEGFFAPVLAALLAAAALRFRFSVLQVAGFLLALIFTFQYIIPVIQFGKGVLSQNDLGENFNIAVGLMTDLQATRERAMVEGVNYDEAEEFTIHYFNQPEGLFDRLQMISIDDALIDITEQGHVFGLSPILFHIANLVPHFIWPGKPSLAVGNTYMHEISRSHMNYRSEDDTTTGISFTPTADAFHEARWLGVTLVAPVLWFLSFFAMDWVCGDTRKSPWGLLAIVSCAHQAPEGMLNGPFILMSTGIAIISGVCFLAAYVLPIVGTLFVGPGRSDPLPFRRPVALAIPDATALEPDALT